MHQQQITKIQFIDVHHDILLLLSEYLVVTAFSLMFALSFYHLVYSYDQCSIPLLPWHCSMGCSYRFLPTSTINKSSSIKMLLSHQIIHDAHGKSQFVIMSKTISIVYVPNFFNDLFSFKLYFYKRIDNKTLIKLTKTFYFL